MTDITDQADQWTQTATPGPWYVHTDPDDQDGTFIYDEDGHMCIAVAPAGSDYREADLTLAAAAPLLAAQIAGMQWEYGVEQHTLDSPHWHTAIPYDRGFDEDKCTQLAETFRANNPHNKYRIVRRLVSKPEVID